ncbi:hypothetical protein [Geobacter sp.]|uniref:phage late control D family protein n=1 Tax=Geobacter sp. TaxID=46610 RepID=UPI00262E2429|nr:hypothetical protein [Geobacter sp.]
MAIFELISQIYVPTFAIKVGGAPLDDRVAKSVLEVSVTEFLGSPSQFSFRLNDPGLRFIEKGGGIFTEGTKVEIGVGYVGKTKTLLVGEVAAVAADFPASGPPTLGVEGFDLLHRLTRGTTYRSFGGPGPQDGFSHGQVVSRVAGEVGLGASVDPALTRSEPVVQYYRSNLQFLEQLAEADGCFLWIEGETLQFRTKPREFDPVSLEWGKTLVSFSPRLTTAGQVEAVVVRSWDPGQKSMISHRAPASSAPDQVLAPAGIDQVGKGAGGKSELVIEDPRVLNDSAAQALAERIYFEKRKALLTGNGSAAGNPGIRPGTVLNLQGLGKRFSGAYVVEQATHTVGGSGYQTSFEARWKG